MKIIGNVRLNRRVTIRTNPPVVGGGGGGGGITINGSGFGSKTTAAPKYFNTFESETVADNTNGSEFVTVAGLQQLHSSGAPFKDGVTNIRAHSGTKSLYGVYDIHWVGPAGNDNTESFPNLGIQFNSGDNIRDCYQCGWYYYERISGTGYQNVLKMGRMGCGSPYTGNPAFVITAGSVVYDIYTLTGAGSNAWTDPQEAAVHTALANAGFGLGSWVFIEYVYRLSSGVSSLADGIAQIKIMGSAVGGSSTAIMTRANGVTDTLTWAILPMDGAAGRAGLDWNDNTITPADSIWNFYGDECLIDASPVSDGGLCRVIVTNSATYTSSTKFAPQSITSWSNTSISITSPNRSNFSVGEACWAHVWDANNTYINAYSISGGMP